MRPGKEERLKRIFDARDGRAVCVAADHGWMSDLTFNVVKLRDIVQAVRRGGADAILMSMGQAVRLGGLLSGRRAPALLVRADWMNLTRVGGANELMNAVPVQKLRRVAAGRAEDALRLGASAITVYYFIGYGDEFEAYNIELCAAFAREAGRIGLPCIIEPMAVGGLVTGLNVAQLLTTAARAAVEIGADALKIQYTNDVESFRKLVQAAGVPVMMLGGARSFLERDALEIVAEGLNAGAAGVVFGRNVTKTKDPEAVVRRICALVHQGASVDDVYRLDLGPRIRLRPEASRCTGCKLCIIACHEHQHGAFGLSRAALRVDSKPLDSLVEGRPLHRPMLCNLCGKCVLACEDEALVRDELSGALRLHTAKCTGCRKCVAACPLVVVGWDEERRLPVICDLCEGAPHCAKYCDRQAIAVLPAKEREQV